MKPHPHAELIKAWADGAEIEYRAKLAQDIWCPMTQACWDLDWVEFRIKPEPKPDVVREYWVTKDAVSQLFTFQKSPLKNNLKLTFDGETGKLKSAEVINA